MAYHEILKVAWEAMVLAKWNSCINALNIVFNILKTPLFYKKFSLMGPNSAVVVPTSRVPRYSDHKNINLTTSLELMMRPTALTPSTSLGLVLLRGPQYLMFCLCLPSLRSPLCQCSRFHHPLLLVWILTASLICKNP